MYIGVDVGGTNVRIGLLDEAKTSHQLVKSVSFPVDQDFQKGITSIITHIKHLTSESAVRGIGVSLPGVVNADGVITGSANLPEWVNKPVKQIVREALKTDVKAAHDVATSAIGEAVYGSGKNVAHFVYIIWGTGFGGVAVELIGEKLHLSSFEPGHYSTDLEGKLCPCQQRGCPELIIGGGSLNKRIGGKWEQITDKDPLWNEVAFVASQVVQNTIMFHPTPLMIFGGGLILKRKFLLQKIKEKVQPAVALFPMPRLELSVLGEDTGLYGSMGLFTSERI